MRVAVTGAGGLTGGEVVRVLAGSGGTDVVGIVRRPERRRHIQGVGEVTICDVRDVAGMDAALSRCDALVHVAGVELGEALATVPNLRRLEAVIVVSSTAVRSRHRASAAAYLRGEEALRAARPDTVVIRPAMIYGSRRDRNVHKVIDFARRLWFLPLFGRGDAYLQPIHYGDLARAIVALIGKHETRPVEAGGAEPLTVRDAGEAIFTALGRPSRFLELPLAPSIWAGFVADLVLRSRFAEQLQRLREDRSVDNSRLIELTGIRPRDFRSGVRAQVLEMYADPRMSGA